MKKWLAAGKVYLLAASGVQKGEAMLGRGERENVVVFVVVKAELARVVEATGDEVVDGSDVDGRRGRRERGGQRGR